MSSNAHRMFKVRCPRCGGARLVRGAPHNEGYPIVDGVRERHCARCRSTVNYGHPNSTRAMLLTDREWLAKVYSEMSTVRIAVALDCSPSSVNRWLRRHGIPLRSQREAQVLRNATKSEYRLYARNRQPVTGDGFADGHTGAVRHLA